MLDAGLNVTINTDDPVRLAHHAQPRVPRGTCSELGMSMDVLKQRILAAAQASFLPEKDKKELVKSVKKELKSDRTRRHSGFCAHAVFGRSRMPHPRIANLTTKTRRVAKALLCTFRDFVVGKALRPNLIR